MSEKKADLIDAAELVEARILSQPHSDFAKQELRKMLKAAIASEKKYREAVKDCVNQCARALRDSQNPAEKHLAEVRIARLRKFDTV